MSTKAQNLLIDLTLLALFVVIVVLGFRNASLPREIHSATHEWLGLLMACVVVVHLVRQARWIAATTRALLRKLPRRTRVLYGLDVLLLVLFGAIVTSGLMISGTLGHRETASAAWTGLHHLSTKLAVLAVVAHLVLHWRWLVGAVRERLPGLRVLQSPADESRVQ